MRVLFVHQNFPGQYKHLAAALAAKPDNQVVSLSINKQPPIQGVQSFYYPISRGNTQGIHPWVVETETKVIRGEACARAALELRQKGFIPDVICAHPGWGESLFLKDVFPEAKLLAFIEFYYQNEGADSNFDPEFSDHGFESRCRLRMKNANNLLNLDLCDWGVSPTWWQWQTIPELYRPKVSIIHDGIDTDFIRPNPDVTLGLKGAGITLSRHDEIVTFVGRNLEPYRGFHSFMRALPEILKRRPQARVLIVGGDDVSYGQPLPKGQTYRQKYLAEVGDRLDMSRVHFVGRIPYNLFINFLQISTVHIYLTYPFVLSWSMLEAMSAGCVVVGSATPPVQEVIEDGVNGFLADFFSPEQIADKVVRVLENRADMEQIRKRARQTVVDRYELKSVCLPKHVELVERLAAK